MILIECSQVTFLGGFLGPNQATSLVALQELDRLFLPSRHGFRAIDQKMALLELLTGAAGTGTVTGKVGRV